MKGNQKHLHSQDLKEYYNCLEIINNENNLLSSAIDDLSWCESKLQEGKNLVKSFGFKNQSINNLPKVNFYSRTTDKTKVENILVSINNSYKEIVDLEKDFAEIQRSCNVYNENKFILLVELQPFENSQKYIKKLLPFFYTIVGLAFASFFIDLDLFVGILLIIFCLFIYVFLLYSNPKSFVRNKSIIINTS